MAPAPTPAGGDPRPAPSDAAGVDSTGHLRPEVAATAAPGGPWLVWGGAAALGLVAFAFLASHRPGAPRGVRDLTTPTNASTSAIATPPPPPTELDALEAQARAGGAPPPPAPPAPTMPVIVPPVAITSAPVVRLAPPTIVAQPNPDAQRRRAPSLVVDFGEQAAVKPPNGSTAANGPRSVLNGDEQFATRVGANTQPDRSRATLLRNQPTTIAQGALIPAVLETALNSDLPGFTRAVVSRDVRSFDGTQVLIPRGSRLIGEYRSGVAQGASRAFVIWTRVLRPDGVSIQIGSSGADDLGRAGLAGKVDRHFFERFSGALLLSIISLGGQALTSGNSTSVVIGSSGESALGGAAGAFAPQNISPTIKVPQGTPILVFVARDLDFTPVEPDR